MRTSPETSEKKKNVSGPFRRCTASVLPGSMEGCLAFLSPLPSACSFVGSAVEDVQADVRQTNGMDQNASMMRSIHVSWRLVSDSHPRRAYASILSDTDLT